MVIFPEDHQNQPTNNINTQRYNPSLLNHRDILIIVMYINIKLLFLRFFLFSTYGMLVGFLLGIINGIYFPSLFYCFNSKLRQFYLRQFWENAPNFLQFFNPDRVTEMNNADNNIELGPLPKNRSHKKSHAHYQRNRQRF